MCGICGIYDQDTRLDVTPGVLARMCARMEHRGPDSSGTYVSGDFGFGAKRLAIVDIEGGTQPIHNENRSVWVVANAEIYNHQEERQRLEKRGHRFRTSCDVEVLLHLYEEYGTELTKHVEGMFAFAIWNEQRRELFLARDRIGVKPLFYARLGRSLVFASEIKAIVAIKHIPTTLDEQSLHNYFAYNYIPGNRTIYRHIRSLAPGHYLRCRQGKTEIRKYWELRYPRPSVTDEGACVERVRELLGESVRKRLMADVPVGVLLSGGLDSSALVAMMAACSDKPVRTFAVGFEQPSFDERKYARLVSRHFGTVHREMVITARDVADNLERHLHYVDEPYADGSAIPMFLVCEMASREVTVLLSGEGGDEVFGGYDTYAAFQAANYYRHVPRWIRKAIVAPMVMGLPAKNTKLSFEFRAKRFVGGVDLLPLEAHFWWRHILTEGEQLLLYSPEFRNSFRAASSVDVFRSAYRSCEAHEELSRLQFVDTKVYLPSDLLVKADRMSMAHSVEVRVPMTDRELVEWCARMPSHLKVRRLNKKHVLKRAMDGILPRAVIRKRKVGFDMPISEWLKHDLRDLMMDILSADAVSRVGYLSASYVEELIRDHLSNRRDNWRILWGLINFMVWHSTCRPG